MTTLVLGAVGTLVGGPVGGALGAAIGNRIDSQILSRGGRQGPRLKELSVTTSSYGQAIPTHVGAVRTSGTVVWATDLKEDSETSGGKGKPKTTTYSYSMSFAVLLSSSPVERLGRIWADGNLLRGAGGDLKTGGQLRFYEGRRNQSVDPLLAAALGSQCPAYRGCAYVVFEDLQLAEFGNRLPALTFELHNGSGAAVVPQLVRQIGADADETTALPDIAGYSHDGAILADALALLDTVEPLSFDQRALSPTIVSTRDSGLSLTADAAVWDEGDYGAQDGMRSDRSAEAGALVDGLRYYDIERDYLPGLQRRPARSPSSGNRLLELPATLSPGSARRIVDRIAERGQARQGRLQYRVPDLDPRIGAGSIVRLPDRSGAWRVEAWEWRERGIEYELSRYRHAGNGATEDATSSGSPWLPRDRLPSASFLEAFELPADGRGGATTGSTFVAVGGFTGRWPGASLYTERGGTLVPVGDSAGRRAVVGSLLQPLGASRCLMFEPDADVEVQLHDAESELASTTSAYLSTGANRVLIGNEIAQFADAVPLGNGRWRLTGLLRGRGATEAHAVEGHASGTRFVLLDDRLVDIGSEVTSADTALAALGPSDPEPVRAPVTTSGNATAPLMPVHGTARRMGDGSLALDWVRRARGAWSWRDHVGVPLVEEIERYEVGIGPVSAPLVSLVSSQPSYVVPESVLTPLADTAHAVWVRQIGDFSTSPALFLTTVSQSSKDIT